MKIEESHFSRRRFLYGSLGGGAAALAAMAAVPLGQYCVLRAPPPDFLAIEESVYDLAPGTSTIVMYGRIPALLLKTPTGELKTFVATCTHFDCTVTYKDDENVIFCACHDGYYDVEGHVLKGPPPRPLREFHRAFVGDKLVIALEKENLEKALQKPPL